MRLSRTDKYDAPPATVVAAFTDDGFVKERYAALGYPEYEVLAIEPTEDGGTRVQTRRVVPANVPGFAKKLFGETEQMFQTDEWGADEGNGTRRGSWRIDVPGKPVSANGTLRMEPTGSGTTVTIEGDLKVKVPLIGGRLESWIGGEAMAALENEYAFTQRWLAER